MIFQLRWRDGAGKQHSKSLGKVSKRHAKMILNRFELELTSGRLGMPTKAPKQHSLSQFIDDYVTYSRSTKAPKTADMDELYLNRLLAYTGDMALSGVTRAHAEGYVRHRQKTMAPTSVNMEIRHLKAAFNYACEWEWIEENPWKRVKQLRVPEKDVPQFLEVEDIQRLREAMEGHPIQDLVEFYLLTGARLREGISLMGEDVDLKRGVVHLRGRNTKSKRNRMIPFGLLPTLRKLLEAQKPMPGQPVFQSTKIPGHPWDASYVQHTISRMLDKIGCPWATTHTLRHTFASQLVMKGVEMYTVSRLLGHSSITVTEQHYAHLAPSHAEQALAKLPYAIPSSSTSGNEE